MGGQHGYFGLWLDFDFGHGHSRARPRCTTYGSPQLSGDEDFKLDTVEVWAVGQPPEELEQVCDRNITIVNFVFLEFAFWFKKCVDFQDEKKKSILDADPEVQAMMEMTGKTLHSQGLREPEEDEEQWGRGKKECWATINRIQNKCFCLYNKCVCTVYIYYVYIKTHTHIVYI